MTRRHAALAAAALSLAAPALAAPFAYVPGYNDRTLTAVDLATGAAVRTVDAAVDAPYGVATTPDGTRVYLSALGGGLAAFDTAQLLDTTPGAPTGWLTTAGTPTHHSLAVSPDGARVYAAGRDSGALWVLDVAAGQTHTVGGMSNPVGVATSPDGRWVGVGNYGGTFALVDAATEAVATVNLLGAGQPVSGWGVAFTPDSRRAVVTCWGTTPAGSLVVIDVPSLELTWVPGTGALSGVAVSPDGRRAWATSNGSALLWEIDLTAAPPAVVGSTDLSLGAGGCTTGEGGGVSVTADGATVLVACPGGNRLVTVEAATAAATGFVPTGALPRSQGVMTAPGLPPAGLVADLPLDADGRDLAQQGRALALDPGTAFVPGRLGGALACGPAGCGALPPAGRLDVAGAITLAAWVRPSAAGDMTVLAKEDGAAVAFALGVTAGGAVKADLLGSPAQSVGGLVKPGRWTHLAATWDGLTGPGHLALYVDGTPVSTGSKLSPPPAVGGALVLGRGAGAAPFAGALDDVRVYAEALPPDRVAALAALREVVVPSWGLDAVTAHRSDAAGNAPPLRRLAGPATLQVGPNAVAVDRGELFLVDHDGHALRVWPAGADGDAAPARTVAGGASGLSFPSQIAVRGEEVFVSQYNGALSVFARDADGGAAPLRTIGGLSNTYALAVDGAELFVARHPDSGDPSTIYVYDRDASAASSPLRSIAGPATGLSFASALATARHELYAASYFNHAVRVFDRRASGDAAPLRSIAGAATGLSNPIGLAVVDDELWVSNRGGGELLVFGLRDAGDVAPRRRVGGPFALLSQPMAPAAVTGPGPVVNGGFEADAPGSTALTGLGTAFFTHDDAGRLGAAPLPAHELWPSEAKAMDGRRSLRSFIGNQGIGNGDPNRRHATHEVVAACVDLSGGPLVLWRSDVAYTTSARWAWRLSVELDDGRASGETMLACRSWGNGEGCPGNFLDTHDATAGAVGGTFYRHRVHAPAGLDLRCVTVTVRHEQDAWDGSYAESELFLDSIAVGQDATAPAVTFALPVAAATAEVAVTLTATDEAPVTGWCLSEVDDPAACAWAAAPPASWTFTGLTEGVAADRTLFAFARDAYGNVSPSASATVAITLPDVTPPVVTAFDLPPAAAAATVAFDALAATDAAGVTAWCVQESADPAGCAWAAARPTAFAFAGLPVAVPAVRTLHAFARDAAGNVSAPASDAVTITLPDVTAPVVTAFGLPAAAAAPTVAFAAPEAADDVGVDAWCVQESSDPAGCTWLAAPPTGHAFAGVPVAVPTARTLHAFARDAAGNVSAPAASTVTITIPDVTPPVVTVFELPPDAAAAAVTFGGLGAVDDVGVEGWCVQESSDPAGCTWLAAPPAGHRFAGLQPAVPAVRTLHAFARDAAGNVSAPASASVTITLPDVTPPQVTTFAPPGAVPVPRVTVTALAATDDVGVDALCVVEGTDPAGCAWVAAPPITLALGGTGPRVVSAFARDAAGNVSAPATAAVAVTPLPGDLDLDGEVTLADARAVWEAVLGRRTLTTEERGRADVAPFDGAGDPAGDGAVDALDAIAIVRIASVIR